MIIIYLDSETDFIMERLDPPPVIGPPTEEWYNRRMRIERAAANVSMQRSDEQRAKASATRATAGKKADRSGNTS
jgi:hypothetical protein